MSAQRVIALLGRRDEPTDAVEEYCRLLGDALAEHSYQVELRRVPWNEHGWAAALNALKLQAESWRGLWVLVQYTSLAWSPRGFPQRFLRVLAVLRRAGARIAVVFHDAEPFGGNRLIDRIRRGAQVRVMRDAVAFSDCALLTVPPARLTWLEPGGEKLHFIPVGANLPLPLLEQGHETLHEIPGVAVYGVTGGAPGDRETELIVGAVRFAAKKLGRMRLLVFGRNSESGERALRDSLRDCNVDISVEGVLDGDSLVDRFAMSDLLLFLRGTISSRRGSAIAGIACGLPAIALRGAETDSPITDAGIVLLEDSSNPEELAPQIGEAIARVFSDDAYRRDLVSRSRRAQKESFSWQAIARRYAEVLRQLERDEGTTMSPPR